MGYETLADIVMFIHAAMVIAVFLGILVSVRYKKFRPVESAILLTLIIIWSLYGGCPLTSLENYLRIQAENPIPLMEVGFIPFYLIKWLKIPMTNAQITIATYVTVLVFFAMSVEWLNTLVNPQIFKLRKFLKEKLR